jgi:hypothetical protein
MLTCFICGDKMHYHFSKQFQEPELGKVDYHACGNCGFTISKNHLELSNDDWVSLNIGWHRQNNQREENPWNREQRYFNQGQMLYLLKKCEIIQPKRILDWGSGEGLFSRVLNDIFDIQVLSFDKYIEPKYHAVQSLEGLKSSFELVLNNAVFEHVTSRETLDEINSYVNNTGCLSVHTLVRENIPADPDWMYLLPVHSCFHTNKSMEILMKQWGYTCSVYNEVAKLWVFFKADVAEMEKKISSANKQVGFNYFKFKEGFMDYWK